MKNLTNLVIPLGKYLWSLVFKELILRKNKIKFEKPNLKSNNIRAISSCYCHYHMENT